MKEIQKLRGRPKGVSLVGLVLGKKVDLEDEMAAVNINILYFLDRVVIMLTSRKIHSMSKLVEW